MVDLLVQVLRLGPVRVGEDFRAFQLVLFKHFKGHQRRTMFRLCSGARGVTVLEVVMLRYAACSLWKVHDMCSLSPISIHLTVTAGLLRHEFRICRQ